MNSKRGINYQIEDAWVLIDSNKINWRLLSK